MEVSRTVVVCPGSTFGPYCPQLFFPMFAAMRRGATPRAIEWGELDQLDGLDPAGRASWVDAQVRPAVTELDPGATLIVGKSLGTHAATVAADGGVPAIWVTPLLTIPTVVDALRRATAPFLLVGGTADNLWDARLARELTTHVLELTGADHGLFVPGPLAGSAENMTALARAAEAFIDGHVWPAQPSLESGAA